MRWCARSSTWICFSASILALLVGAAAEIARAKEPAPTHADLLIGYDLLAQTLSGEGGLGMLRVFKKLTFSDVGKDVSNVMKALGEASRKRSKELEKLRKLEPEVTDKPPPSPIGDAIQAAATEAGKHEMMHPDGTFSVRFLMLQAQATRMVAVMAAQVEKIDPNAERQKWLAAVAKEYEGYHSDVVTVVEKHSRFSGDER